jgi:hypothetical protein
MACVPVLKTNSLQGVLVFGRREKRVSWEAEELIAAFTRLLVSKHGFGLESFCARCRPDDPGETAQAKRSLVYYPRLKPARQRPFRWQLRSLSG